MMNTESRIIKYDYIDALRGWAILGVVAVHCTSRLPAILADFQGSGRMGVQLFFVVSACTLWLSLTARKSEEGFISNFFIRRIFRIAPLYYSAIIYYLLQNGLGSMYRLGDASGISVWNILSNVLFIHGINPYWINSLVPGGWSITDEMMFYCVLPILFCWVKSINHAFFLFFVLLFLQGGLRIVLSSIPVGDPNLWNGFLYYYFPNQLPVFLCGVILFFLISTPREQLKISPIVFLIFSSLFLFDLCTGRQIISSHIRFGLIFILIGYALSQKPYYLLVNPLIRYIGKVSFGIYFTHFAVLHHLGNWSQEILARTFGEYRFYQIINKWGGVFQYITVLLISLVISSLLYYSIETPCQKLGSRIIRRRMSRSCSK